MHVLLAVLGPTAAIVGVLVGGLITSRAHTRAHALSIADKRLTERRDACIDFLAAVRTFRRYVMYSEPQVRGVGPTADEKGSVGVEGRAEHDARIDAALSRVMVVAGSEVIVTAAMKLARDTSDFVTARADQGREKIPDAEVERLRSAEQNFATTVIKYLEL
ncbi:hypothetical protein [Nocardia alba]|uniref:Uncharacterized protein n=1 Tax=Nocardia alba TaxID=225051 RepID=A0A4R1FYR9_9NOCA|nr:hypothetical protein [Nocardia alba]TCJ96411.1 hypothetical protein DFR71_2441 [Nocardia alba]